MQRLRRLLSVTAIRLTVIYSALFGVMALGLIFYLTASTVDLLRKQIESSINDELLELRTIYEEGGLNSAVRALEIRASAPGANLFVVADPTGRILAGNVYELDSGVLNRTGWTRAPFKYSRFDASGDDEFRAVARIVELPNGMRLLVGRDIGEPEHFRKIIRNALIFAVSAMVLLGFITWFFVGRRALKRIDLVSKSTERILAGDRDERLPVTGSGDEFDRLSLRMNAMLDRIGHLDEGLRQVSDNIAHDLKTPLTRIRNQIEASLALPGNGKKQREDREEALNKVLGESENLIKTFNALLMISRVESGSSAAELAEQDFSAIIADIAELYEPLAEDEGFKLLTHVEDGLKVRGNRELLSQAVSNLIDNALKYGRAAKGGENTIEVTTSAINGDVTATIADHGPGIPPEAREKVLERFQRLEKSRNKPGSGLGLSLVDAVVKLHGGRLALEDNQPGLRATITIPRLKSVR